MHPAYRLSLSLVCVVKGNDGFEIPNACALTMTSGRVIGLL